MTSQYDEGKAALDHLIDWYGEHRGEAQRNEATTRFHLIDTLVHDVLGWPKEQVTTEERVEGQYIDYSLGKPSTRLILEAKKEGLQFEVPVGTTTLVQKIPSLTEGPGSGRNLRSALEQVVGYCARKGVQLAAVCNGTQLIAFLGVRTDGPPLEGSALIFTSLSAMRENFYELWQNLSKPGVEARNLYVTLRAEETPSAPLPLSANIPHYPGHKRRNDIQTGLQIMAELFLEDVTRDPSLEEDFLRKTYATSGALSQYAVVSKRILETRYTLLHEPSVDLESEPAVMKRGMNPKLRDDMLASGMGRRPIILLGDVGVGKTMFIRNLIHVEAKDVFEKSIVLYVDFGTQASISRDLTDFAIAEMEAQLMSSYSVDTHERKFVEAVYHSDLRRFDKGIYGELKEFDPPQYRRERIKYLESHTRDRGEHLRRSLNHLRSTRSSQIVIFLDNIDQWESAFQERVFLLAESLAARWPATVFVSLRPDTFHRSRAEGTLAAYQPRAFTIAPPRLDVVLKNRLRFALDQLSDHSRLGSFPSGVTVESDSLKQYLEMLLDNFEENRALNSLIDNLSAGNVRRGLEFVSRFIGSGHVDTRKILGAYERSSHYTIPLHEFLRAIIYGDSEHYDPDVSSVANLFNVSQPDGREHFLMGLIITYVEQTGDRAGTEGFVKSDDVYAFAQRCGYNPEQIAWAVDRGSKKGLIERSPSTGGSAHEHMRVTTAGVYTARTLVAMFAYVDAVVVDTPILDSNYRRLITNARDIDERLRRADIFRAYLDRQWRLLDDLIDDLPFNWSEHSDRLRAEVERISMGRSGRDRNGVG
jgi:hypothetical protein